MTSLQCVCVGIANRIEARLREVYPDAGIRYVNMLGGGSAFSRHLVYATIDGSPLTEDTPDDQVTVNYSPLYVDCAAIIDRPGHQPLRWLIVFPVSKLEGLRRQPPDESAQAAVRGIIGEAVKSLVACYERHAKERSYG